MIVVDGKAYLVTRLEDGSRARVTFVEPADGYLVLFDVTPYETDEDLVRRAAEANEASS